MIIINIMNNDNDINDSNEIVMKAMNKWNNEGVMTMIMKIIMMIMTIIMK